MPCRYLAWVNDGSGLNGWACYITRSGTSPQVALRLWFSSERLLPYSSHNGPLSVIGRYCFTLTW